jgi:FAD/FMN-containing dehydrogenase/Fe-S oxidoreductase
MKRGAGAAVIDAGRREAHAALEQRLRGHIRGALHFDAASRGRYATDASIYQQMPLGVFVPADEADVEAALAAARELGVPVLPRGAGTSQCGQTVGAGLVVDHTKHLRRLLDVDTAGRRARVQPGVVLDALNAELKKFGLWFPVDVSTGAQATLGGMAGNNSCGSRSIAYGNMVHNVLGAEVWLAEGGAAERFGRMDTLAGRAARIGEFVRRLAHAHAAEIDAHWPRVLRRVGGYNLDIFHPVSERPYAADSGDAGVNLAHLFVGAEGTLGFVKTLDLALVPPPRAKVLGVANFARFAAAMSAAQHIVKLGPSAVELVDRTMIELARANPAFRPVIDAALVERTASPQAVLLVEFAGDERAALLPQLDRLDELMGDLGHPASVVKMPDEPAQKALWEVRKAGLNIMMSLKGDGKPVSFIEDCAVPLEHLADYTAALTEVFGRHGTRGTWYAHASVGTLHVRPILDMRRDGAAKMRAIAEEAAALVRRFKGAYSGEHGDGLCRGEWIGWQFGPKLGEAFRAIKKELDPRGLFCPNRIVDAPKMDTADLFRFPPPHSTRPYRTIELKPALDWQAWNVQNDPRTEAVSAPGSGGDSTGGLAKAVEMCNNNGHCRKFDAGTMCPSFRVTRDEQHGTRGRANTLRLALSGQLDGGAGAFTSDAVRDAMDLCVSCKGCKRECPTGVDMARMKIEFLHHWHARHGRSLKERLLGSLPDWAHWAARAPWLANLREHLPGARALGERWLGIAAARALPRWRRDTFWAALADLGLAPAAEAVAAHRERARGVVLFVDTFNGCFETENALAALRVLRAGGYRVHVATREGQPGRQDRPGRSGRHLCCGRTHLASGDVRAARAKARELLDAFAPFVDAGLPVVGLEPSCLFTLRDEMLVMGLGEAAERLAARALLFGEFLAAEAKAGRFAPKLRAPAGPVLVHGHCHQKAFGAVPPLLDVLALLPGAKPQLVESSCCGLAGSFGYEAAHHAVSMQMAELALLPALRAAPTDAIVVADGASCRQQIEHGLQGARPARHGAAVLAEHLLD